MSEPCVYCGQPVTDHPNVLGCPPDGPKNAGGAPGLQYDGEWLLGWVFLSFAELERLRYWSEVTEETVRDAAWTDEDQALQERVDVLIAARQ